MIVYINLIALVYSVIYLPEHQLEAIISLAYSIIGTEKPNTQLS